MTRALLPAFRMANVTAFARRVASGLAFALALGAAAGSAEAQGVEYCNRLQAQLASLGRSGGGDPARVAQFQRAAQRQQGELDRTISYARSIGCGKRQFLFFGDAPPAQCGAIEQQIARMQVNLDQLRGQMQRAAGSDDAQRRDLTARFDAYCRGGAQPQQARGGFLDSLFGGSTRDVPLEDTPALPQEDATPRGGSLAVCVRTCDGGFFPVSYSAGRGRMGELGEMCRALCPNAETQVFTMSMGREIEQSVSADGRPYSSLPNAGKFKTKFDSACSCKAANQTWVEALANAEKMLGRESRRDQIVTPERAAELSKPTQARMPAKPDPRKAFKEQKVDDQIAADEAAGAQAPTASRDSAGIALGRTTAGSTFSLNDGATREVTTPEGTKKRVRTVGPLL